MNANDSAIAQSANRGSICGFGTTTRLVLLLVIGVFVGVVSTCRGADEVMVTRGKRSSRRLARPRLSGLEPALDKLGRIAQPPEASSDTDVQLPAVTLMESLDLRVPELSELSTASEAERVEIPDYASALFSDSRTIAITRGGGRGWVPWTFMWASSSFGHSPLYFEDVNLERHGHSLGIAQPAVSAGLALGQLVALPSQMVAQPPWECIYTLGEDRPGNCVPCEFRLPALSLPGSAAEAGVIAGLILLIP